MEAEKAKKKKERDQKKEDELRAQEQKQGQEGGGQGAEEGKDKPKENGHVAAPEVPDFPPEVHLTERQRLAIQTKKEQEEREKQKKVDIIKSQAGKMSNKCIGSTNAAGLGGSRGIVQGQSSKSTSLIALLRHFFEVNNITILLLWKLNIEFLGFQNMYSM